jgi:hypothetical protein
MPPPNCPTRSGRLVLADDRSPDAGDAIATRLNALVDSHAASVGKLVVLPNVST